MLDVVPCLRMRPHVVVHCRHQQHGRFRRQQHCCEQIARLTRRCPRQEIRGPDGGVIRFEIDQFRKHCLINGLDDIGLTLEKAPHIEAYEKRQSAGRPWL